MRRRAFAVVDLGFGDAGKGLATDYLTRRESAGLVVRFNGGAQAGHNVVTPDGRHHTFSQFGAGSFVDGVRTFLAPSVVVHPTALLVEAEALSAVGVPQALRRVDVSASALVVTPFHQAAGRLREVARGAQGHGTVGVGVGEAVRCALEAPLDAVRARDLVCLARPGLGDRPRFTHVLRAKLAQVQERLVAELRGAADLSDPRAALEWSVLTDTDVARRWRELAAPVAQRVVPDEALAAVLSRVECAVFEGAQGLLLDETLGFHPFTTWSDCTAAGAARLLAEHAPGTQLHTFGVLRAHAVRHGPGPLPSEDSALAGLVDEHNRAHPWQGRVRYGWFDALLARYAMRVAPPVDTWLLTHVDALSRRASWFVSDGYVLEGATTSAGVAAADLVSCRRDGVVTDLVADPRPKLERQARLAALLAACRAVPTPAPSDERAHLRALEGLVGRRIGALSRGPTARDVELCG